MSRARHLNSVHYELDSPIAPLVYSTTLTTLTRQATANYMQFFKSPPAFRPLSPPLPPRKPCTSACNQQKQSRFLTKLPPEIRNEIYRYVFSSEASKQVVGKSHPLSLLVTCHKINHEATNMAFYTHVFAIRMLPTFLSFRNKVSCLSVEQLFAVTALSYDMGKEYIDRNPGVADIITNALLTLPSLSRFEIYIQRGHKYGSDVHNSPIHHGASYTDPRKAAVEKYAPNWFDYKILRAIENNQPFSWQAGEKWRVEWPQLDTPYFLVDDVEDENGYLDHKPNMGTEAIGAVRGVHQCVCGCGEVTWLSANLIQQTGRRILVDTFFYREEERPKTPEEWLPHLEYQLGPAERSLANLVDKEYRKGIRRRRWKLGSFWRWFWG